MSIDHFPLPGIELLNTFSLSFEDGAQARTSGVNYTECPHGLPGDPEWTQGNLVCLEDPEVAGWLLGWWASEYAHFDEDNNSYPNVIRGASEMAAFLWIGSQWDGLVDTDELEDSNNEVEPLYSIEAIAEALGISVEDAQLRANQEGWVYTVVPDDKDQPELTVHQGGKDDE